MKPECLILALAVIVLVIPVAGTQDLVITQPSINETNFAEMRDFYVYGIFPEPVIGPGDIRIELFPGDSASGQPVRTIQSMVDPVTGITNESVIDSSYPNATRMNNVMVPDLVMTPGTILDPGNKLVVTNRYYLGFFPGGVTKNFDINYTNPDGSPLADLTAGRYTIRVTGLSGRLAGQVVNETVTFGITDSVLGSFRNIPNQNQIIAYAAAHHRRVYLDWFPGYFTDPDNSSRWYESPGRWKPNNGIEVVNNLNGTKIDTVPVADNTMFIYNINNGSTTYKIELSAILRYHLQDDPKTTFLSYNIGEPNITYRDAASGTIRTIPGTPVPFPPGKRLEVARAEIFDPTGTSYENLYDPNDVTTPKTLDLTPSDGIALFSGKEFVLYGAAKPIASTVTPTGQPYEFAINNRIARINCTIKDSSGAVVSTSLHDVNLSRLYNAGSSQRFNSLWEFGIDIPGLTNPGNYTVTLFGLDVPGIRVSGTETSYPVSVVPAVDFTGDPLSGDAPLPVRFTDRSAVPVTSYAWDFSNNGTIESTLKNPVYTYTVPGKYSVRLNITGPEGNYSTVKTNYITVNSAHPKFLANFTVSPVNGTAPLTVRCTDTSTGNPGLFIYDFGDGFNMTGPDPVHTYRFPGIYTITLTTSKYNATSHVFMTSVARKPDVIAVTPVVRTPLSAAFNAAPTNGTAPFTVTFTDQSLGVPDFWDYDFGDGINATGRNQVHTYRFPGVFNVTLTVMKHDPVTGSVSGNTSTRKGLIVVD